MSNVEQKNTPASALEISDLVSATVGSASFARAEDFYRVRGRRRCAGLGLVPSFRLFLFPFAMRSRPVPASWRQRPQPAPCASALL
jgi:hypothetical protein